MCDRSLGEPWPAVLPAGDSDNRCPQGTPRGRKTCNCLHGRERESADKSFPMLVDPQSQCGSPRHWRSSATYFREFNRVTVAKSPLHSFTSKKANRRRKLV